MWKVQATGDRIRAVFRHDSEHYRGQGRDRKCDWGMKTNRQRAGLGNLLMLHLKPKGGLRFH